MRLVSMMGPGPGSLRRWFQFTAIPGPGQRRERLTRKRGARSVLLVLDRRRPAADLFRRHHALGPQPRVAVAPLLDVLEVLLPRQQRPLADALVGRRAAQLVAQSLPQFVHD